MQKFHQIGRMLAVSKTNGNDHSAFCIANTLLSLKRRKTKAEAFLQKEGEQSGIEKTVLTNVNCFNTIVISQKSVSGFQI